MARGIPSEVIRHFQAVPLFKDVSKPGIRAIVSAATEADVRAGKELVREGEFGRHLYVILGGEAIVTRGGRRLARLGPGDFFGELAFLDGAPRSATVTARTDLQVMIVGPREFDVVVEREPAIAKRLLATMAKRVRQEDRSHTV
ncbi:MAG TPA: cyclic nucleotide-binding domain-containing protein [Actinomycetota bacterium]|nr:cyclic nucleotide-binding domain-containing protein [Actinomycetota bacterium]